MAAGDFWTPEQEAKLRTAQQQYETLQSQKDAILTKNNEELDAVSASILDQLEVTVEQTMPVSSKQFASVLCANARAICSALAPFGAQA